MYVYNLGVHSYNDKTGHMYMWNETEGGRSLEDIASCLRKHLKENTAKYEHVMLFSDVESKMEILKLP